MLLEQLGEELVSEKDEIRTLFLQFEEHTVTVDDLLLSSSLKKVQTSIEDLLITLSEKSRTGKLWVEYFRQVCTTAHRIY